MVSNIGMICLRRWNKFSIQGVKSYKRHYYNHTTNGSQLPYLEQFLLSGDITIILPDGMVDHICSNTSNRLVSG